MTDPAGRLAEPPNAGEVESTGAMPTTEIRRRALLSAALVGARGIAIHIVAFVGNVALARLLVPREFGIVALGLALLSFAELLADGGLGAGLVRRQEPPSREDLRALVALQIVSTTVLAAVALAVGLQLGTTGSVAGVMMLALPFESLRGPVRIRLQRDLHFGPIAAGEIAEVLAYYGLGLGLVAAGLGVWGLAVAAVAKAVAGTIVLFATSRIAALPPLFSLARVRALMRFGVRFQAVQVVSSLRDQGASIGTGAIGGVALLGLWTVAWKLLQVPFLLYDALWRVSYPALSQLMAAGEDPKPVIERIVGLTAVATGLMLSVLVGATPGLIPALFGARYADAIDVIPITCAALQVSGPVSVATAGYLMAAGRIDVALRATILQVVLWFGITFPLLGPVGVPAVGIGYFVAALTESVFFGRAARRGSGARLVPGLALPLVAAVIGSTGGWAVAKALGPDVAGAIAGGATAVALYVLVLGVLRRSLLAELVALGRRAATGLVASRAGGAPAPAGPPGT